MGRCYDGAMGERITTVAFVSLLLCGCPAVDDDTTGDDDTTDDDTTADDDTTGDDDTGDDDTGDDDTVVDPGCAYEELWGKFGLTSDLYGGSLSGVYHDDASPMVPDVLVDDGVCVLYGYDPMPVCEPHCTPPDLCGPDEQCHSWPEALDVGTLTVPETSPPLSLLPGFQNQYYTDQEYPELYQVGDLLHLQLTGGGAIGEQRLGAFGVAPIPAWDEQLVLDWGQDLVVTWEPSPIPPDARMLFTISADHHAGTPAYVRCDVPDADGTLTLPAAMVDALLTAGTAGTWGDVIEAATLVRYCGSVKRTEHGCLAFYTYWEGAIEASLAPAKR